MESFSMSNLNHGALKRAGYLGKYYDKNYRYKKGKNDDDDDD